MSSESDHDPISPCVGVCMMDPQTELCDGCFRTIEEIADWWDYEPAQKRAVIARLEDRRQRICDGTYFD